MNCWGLLAAWAESSFSTRPKSRIDSCSACHLVRNFRNTPTYKDTTGCSAPQARLQAVISFPSKSRSIASFEKLNDATAKGKCLEGWREAASPASKPAGSRSANANKCSNPSKPTPRRSVDGSSPWKPMHSQWEPTRGGVSDEAASRRQTLCNSRRCSTSSLRKVALASPSNCCSSSAGAASRPQTSAAESAGTLGRPTTSCCQASS
mmetsp:Transcript_100324/g.323748  ORF Transcript_100324/g.323748 Transcript_100324/m.323748 type:complete len:207 (+) Transcript_100324:177-797(+)